MADSKDTIEITTPNGRTVVIRNYTTHGDDKQAQALLDEGTQVTTGENGEPKVSVTLSASAAAQEKYVELLVESIDGNGDNIRGQLEGLRSEDYQAISDAVRGITHVDPKASSKS